MDTKENRNSAWQTRNYHQPQVDGEDQNITAETDELDPAFNQLGPPIDPEDEEEEDEDGFPAEEDVEEEDFNLNHDEEDDRSLNIDDEELN
jgi:hypothetical protein